MRRARMLLSCALSLAVIATGGLPASAVPAPTQKTAVSGESAVAAQSVPAARPIPAYTPPPAGTPKVTQPARRVGEVVSERREFSTTYELRDGRRETVLSTEPVHYRDSAGRWQAIDNQVTGSDQPGFRYRNVGNAYGAQFGDRSDRLVRFGLGANSVTLGVPGTPKAATPSTSGNKVTFADVFGAADLHYTVGPRRLKEDIVLPAPPDQTEFTFELTLGGYDAKALPDGSIGFYPKSDPETMALRMPKPFMTDSAPDRGSPTGTTYSDAVTQTVSQQGAKTLVTVRASETWLRDPARTYPVRIDPTVEVVATDVTGGQDAEIISGTAAANNYGGSFFIDAGAFSNDKRRSLLKFDTSMIPKGTPIDSAQLQVHFDTTLDSAAAAATIEPRPVTAPWDESTVTWNSINANATGGSMTYNLEQVDDQDAVKVATVGGWAASTNATANKGSYQYNSGTTTGDSFTWVPDITEDGDYRVDVWYVAGTDRATAAPYVVTNDGTGTTYNVDQTVNGGAWRTLGTRHFSVGGDNKVTLKDVSGKTVVADAVRFVKSGQVTKPAGQSNGTHSFSVRSAVQGWVNAQDPATNYGLVLKLPDASEGVGTVGPRYLSSEGGRDLASGDPSAEDAVLPKLIVRYGRASVDLDEPKKIASTGASLSWSEVADPGATPGQAAVEYQVHRMAASDPADQYFTPTNATLIASLPKDQLSFTDTTATPGVSYNYRVAVLTKDGELAPSRTVNVTTPAAGHVVQVVQGDIADTTLSSAQPNANFNTLDGLAKLSVGNLSSTYGNQRAVMTFDTTSVPSNARVLDSKVMLWKRAGQVTAPTARFNLHKLTTAFNETQATWNSAATGTAWTEGGAFDGTVLAFKDQLDPWPGRVTWQGTELTNAVQSWVTSATANRGVLLKIADEAGAVKQRLEFWSGEYTVEPELRPQLWIEYLDPRAATFSSPETPQRMIPNIAYPVDVTVTNTGSSTLPSSLVLSYVWTYPDGSEVTSAGTANVAALGRNLAPGESTEVSITVLPPVNSETGNKRLTYNLNWDLKNPSNGAWLSTDPSSGIVRLGQPVAVEDPVPHDADVPTKRAYELGLEKFFQYTGASTGAGSGVEANLHTGNLVWTYAPISNPSLGPSTFVRLSYNSLDATSSQAGFGMSLQTSTLTRNGSPLVFQNISQGYPGIVSMVDGDGTSHAWVLNDHGSQDQSLWTYDSPPGVHLTLRQNGRNASGPKAWVATRPDGTKFYFDDAGYQSSVVDPNGNTLTFAYDAGTPKRLRTVTDASNRTTLSFGPYDAAGRVQTITDISGRTLTFAYDGDKLVTLTDAAGGESKVFSFTYSTDSTNTNIRLSGVRDPRRPEEQWTRFGYIESTTDSWSNGRLQTITNRLGKVTTFAYADPNGAATDGMQATVTDANQHTSTYQIDDYGRPATATNAQGKTTRLTWDGDNNVSRLAEANGAVTTWTYDADTGYPVTVTDPEQNKTTSPQSTVLAYDKHPDADGAKVAWLTQKSSPLGNSWAFEHDPKGNLTGVTDPAGVATTTVPDDYKTKYTYDAQGRLLTKTDANQHATVYYKIDPNTGKIDYHPSGYPQTIIDAQGNASTFVYDARGNVLKATDANGKETTQTYDGFGRPRVATAPIDAANNLFATTTTTYDLNDNVTQVDAPNPAGQPGQAAVTKSTYNAGDQLVVQEFPTPTTDPRKVTYTYDPVGNLLTTVDPKGNVSGAAGHTTSNGYDELDQLTSTTDAKDGVTKYSYDTVGNLLKVVDAIKSATSDPDDYTAVFGYDLNHRKISATDADGHTSRTRYDADGQVTTAIDADGNITRITRDPRGLVTQVKAPYDVAGPGVDYTTTGYAYDQVGNRTQVIQPRGMATTLAGDYTESTTYDALNRPAVRTLPYNTADSVYKNPVTVSYEYDKVGNLTGVTNPTDTATKVWTRYTHFDTGWIKTSTDPFGIETDYTYTETGQQKSRTLISAAGGSKREMTWDYNTDGSLKSRSDVGAPAGISEVLSDNSDERATAPVGVWPVATAGTGYWGYNYLTHPAGVGNASFTWDLTIPTTGTYDLTCATFGDLG